MGRIKSSKTFVKLDEFYSTARAADLLSTDQNSKASSRKLLQKPRRLHRTIKTRKIYVWCWKINDSDKISPKKSRLWCVRWHSKVGWISRCRSLQTKLKLKTSSIIEDSNVRWSLLRIQLTLWGWRIGAKLVWIELVPYPLVDRRRSWIGALKSYQRYLVDVECAAHLTGGLIKTSASLYHF